MVIIVAITKHPFIYVMNFKFLLLFDFSFDIVEAWLQNGPVVYRLACFLSFFGNDWSLFVLEYLLALRKDVIGMGEVFAAAKSALSLS